MAVGEAERACTKCVRIGFLSCCVGAEDGDARGGREISVRNCGSEVLKMDSWARQSYVSSLLALA